MSSLTSSLHLGKAPHLPPVQLTSLTHIATWLCARRALSAHRPCDEARARRPAISTASQAPPRPLSHGALHCTRVLRALVPVTVALSDRDGRRGSPQKRFAAPPGATQLRFAPGTQLTGGLSLNTLFDNPPQPLPQRSPDDRLDDLPVHEPSDLNGTPLAKASHACNMRALPVTDAASFFVRVQENSNSSSGGIDWRGEDDDQGGSGPTAYAEAAGGGAEYRAGANKADDPALFCRLCREEIAPGLSFRSHVQTSNTGSHVNHVVREVALDTMALLAMRGYPVDDINTVWADTLYHHPALPRVARLSSPLWSIERRVRRVGDLMHALKRIGIIDVALSSVEPTSEAQAGGDLTLYRRRRLGFERLEYMGDSFWSLNISQRLVLLYPDQQWLFGQRSHSFNSIRDACEMNVNLDFVFDTLQIADLLSSSRSTGLGTGKAKADLVEAILGELHTYVIAFAPELEDDVAYIEVNGGREAQLAALLEHCLTELYDLVVLQHARQLSGSAIPLAKELAAKRLWMQTQPPLLNHKRSQRASGSGRNSISLAAIRSNTALPGDLSATSTPDTTLLSGLSDVAPSAAPQEEMRMENTMSSVREVFAEPADGRADSSTTVEREGYQEANNTDGRNELGSVEQAACADTAASDAGVFLPNVSMASAAGLAASIRLGVSYVLPGLPRLFRDPCKAPCVVPHPLRHQPLAAMLRSTYCEYTGTDVFEELVESYARLDLIRDDLRQTRCVVSQQPATWEPLISALVPHLAALAHLAGSSATAAAPSSAAPASTADASSTAASTPPAADEEAQTPFLRDVHSQTSAAAAASAEATRRLFLTMEDNELYCRDGFYDLATTPAAPTSAPSSGRPLSPATAVSVEWTTQHTGLPALSAAPTDTADSHNGGRAGAPLVRSFASSRRVPPGTRAPPAGVVTDRNLCRGIFPFLALGVHNPLEKACTVARAIEAKQSSLATEAVATVGEAAAAAAGDCAAVCEMTAKAAEDGDTQESVRHTHAEQVDIALRYWKSRPRQLIADADLFATSGGERGVDEQRRQVARAPSGLLSDALGALSLL